MNENTKKTLEHEAVLVHLRESYANIQSVTRFMDTKASATIAASTTITSLMGAFLAWLFNAIQLPSSCSFLIPVLFPIFSSITTFCLIYSGYSLFDAIQNAFQCISPRNPEGSVSVLFPFIPVKSDNNPILSSNELELADKGIERINKFVIGPIFWSDVKEDYQNQLSRMGRVVYLKIKFSKSAIDALRLQFLWSLGALTSGIALFLVTKI